MCGLKPCAKCAAKSRAKISGTMTIRRKTKQQATGAAAGIVGEYVADMVMPASVTTNNLYNLAKGGLGIYLAFTSRKPMTQGIGYGLAGNALLRQINNGKGAIETVVDLLPGVNGVAYLNESGYASVKMV